MVMELVDVVVNHHAMALSGGGGDGGAPRRAGPGQAGGPPGQVMTNLRVNHNISI